MSDIFEGYERQYCELSTSLSRRNASLASLNGEQKRQKLQELKKGLEEAESLIRRMDLEARSLSPTQKATLLGKLREYKADLNNLKRDAKKASAEGPTERDELLEGGLGTELTTSLDQRARVLASTSRLNESGDRIRDGRRALLETEELGVSILQDLHQQRQTLLHARDSLHGVDENISKSRQLLNSMVRHMNRNRWILAGIVAVLLFAIVLVLYAKFRGR